MSLLRITVMVFGFGMLCGGLARIATIEPGAPALYRVNCTAVEVERGALELDCTAPARAQAGGV